MAILDCILSYQHKIIHMYKINPCDEVKCNTRYKAKANNTLLHQELALMFVVEKQKRRGCLEDCTNKVKNILLLFPPSLYSSFPPCLSTVYSHWPFCLTNHFIIHFCNTQQLHCIRKRGTYIQRTCTKLLLWSVWRSGDTLNWLKP